MNWCTNPDWWSALGEWIGGIGTVVAIFIALKQIRVQFEIMKPEISLRYSPTAIFTTSVNPDFDSKLSISITNPKQTSVTVSKILCFEWEVREVRFPLFKRMSLKLKIRFLLKRFSRGRGGIFRRKDSYELNVLLHPGQEYTFYIDLKKLKNIVFEKKVILLKVLVQYTEYGKKEIYIILRKPLGNVDPDDDNLFQIMVIKDNYKEAMKFFMKTRKEIEEAERTEQKSTENSGEKEKQKEGSI